MTGGEASSSMSEARGAPGGVRVPGEGGDGVDAALPAEGLSGGVDLNGTEGDPKCYE
jgi:hypothetical protein